MQTKVNILIVDDSSLIIERLVSILEHIGNVGHIFQAAGYDQTLRELSSQKIDLVILDINLGTMNGIELLKLIKKRNPHMLVIMLTNQSGDYYRRLCMRLGADYFLDKSADFEKVSEIILTL